MSLWMELIALAGSIASNNIPGKPQWQADYFAARSLASEERKPLAVFLGKGGWEKVVNGDLDPKATQLLKEKYVCVFIDTDSSKGMNLASTFEVAGTGLVISDRAGTSQQFNHRGDLSPDDLRKALERYADPNRRFASTETLAQLNPPPAPLIQQNFYAPAIRLSGG